MKKHLLFIIACLLSFNVSSQSWEILYPTNKEYKLTGGASNENGNYIFGRSSEGPENYANTAFAMFINNDGDYRTADFETGFGQCSFISALCLEDGNAFVAGRKSSHKGSDLYDSLWIAIINQNLEIVEEHTYPLDEPYISIERICLNTGTNGEILVAATAKRYDGSLGIHKYDSVIFIMDDKGNIIDYKYFPCDGYVQRSRTSDITIIPGTENIMLFGSGVDVYGAESVSCFNRNLEPYAHHSLYTGRIISSWHHAKVWLDSSNFLMSYKLINTAYEEDDYYVAITKCDTMMNFHGTLVYDRIDTADYTAQYCSLVYINDSTLIMPTFLETSGHYSIPNNVVTCLIDKDLNLLATKRLKLDNANIRVLHCQKTNDGGCLIYGKCRQNEESRVLVWKLMRDDFEIPCATIEQLESVVNGDVFPNPTKDIINFPIGNADNSDVTISIVNMQGRKVYERKLHLPGESIVKLDVSSFEQGAYIYQVINGVHSFEGKFIKE